jgi:hypothetical protein
MRHNQSGQMPRAQLSKPVVTSMLAEPDLVVPMEWWRITVKMPGDPDL